MKVTALGFGLAVALAACTTQQQASTSDAALAAEVQARMSGVSADAITRVHVSASDGDVVLTGAARSAAERVAYVAAAESVDGVRSIHDHLTLNPRLHGPQENIDDTTLAARVSVAIAAQSGVNVFHVTPVVHAGRVTLRGSVPSKSVEATIVETVAHVSGVTHVDDRIVVQ